MQLLLDEGADPDDTDPVSIAIRVATHLRLWGSCSGAVVSMIQVCPGRQTTWLEFPPGCVCRLDALHCSWQPRRTTHAQWLHLQRTR